MLIQRKELETYMIIEITTYRNISHGKFALALKVGFHLFPRLSKCIAPIFYNDATNPDITSAALSPNHYTSNPKRTY